MATEVKVPDIGNYTNVPVIEVLVKPGDAVAKDQGLVTLESDKATMEVPSPFAGVVKELKVKVGDEVSEGSIVAVINAADATAPAPKPEAARAEAPKAASAPAAAPAPASPGEATHPRQTSAGYRNIDEFVVTYQRSADGTRYAAIFHRFGLFSWKLSAIDLHA